MKLYHGVSKHEMWHSAEMEAIKVALNYPIVWLEK